MTQAIRRSAHASFAPPADPEHHVTWSGWVAWATKVLRDLEMPPGEIQAALTAADPELVHRYLELHRERLEERVEEQRKALASVERALAEAILEQQARSQARFRNHTRSRPKESTQSIH